MIENRIFDFGASIVKEAEIRKNAINRMMQSGQFTPLYINAEKRNAIEALSKEVEDWFANLKAELQGKLDNIRRSYVKTSGDSAAQLLNLYRLQIGYEAMATPELENKAKQYLLDGVIESIDELNIFLAELRRRNLTDVADRVREAAYSGFYAYQPWKRDAQYKEIEDELKRAEAYGADPMTIYVKAKDGVVEAINLQNLFEV